MFLLLSVSPGAFDSADAQHYWPFGARQWRVYGLPERNGSNGLKVSRGFG